MPLDADQIAQMTLDSLARSGQRVESREELDALVRQVIARVAERSGMPEAPTPPRPISQGRVIISAFGVNRPGLVAAIADTLAQYEFNILDISQKIVADFFTLIVVVDGNGNVDFGVLKSKLNDLGARLGIKILAANEDTFMMMHRV